MWLNKFACIMHLAIDFIVLYCRIRQCSSQSASDSGDGDAVDKTLPGSAIRARKAAAAKEKAEAEAQQERHVSVLIMWLLCICAVM